ncbi:MAG: YciI family protein [Bacteroidales bacterium]|nr:YciI family protein [Bacteroidales bacterium]
MINPRFLFSIIIIMQACVSADNKPETGTGNANEAVYDSVLARELNADPYGMKQYIMAFLLRGDSSSTDSAEAARLQRAHLDNITRLAQEGILLLAGPFLDDTDIRGIYIFNVSTIEEAEKLTGSDPAIKAGVLKMELHPWYGSAALQKLNEMHARIQSDNI